MDLSLTAPVTLGALLLATFVSFTAVETFQGHARAWLAGLLATGAVLLAFLVFEWISTW